MTTRYALLIFLNAPFAVYGLFKSIAYYKDGLYNRTQLCLRLAFWLSSLSILVLAKPVYTYLRDKKLTDSAPLSIADVLLATACFLSFAMLLRLYARLERAEKKLTDLNESLALKTLR